MMMETVKCTGAVGIIIEDNSAVEAVIKGDDQEVQVEADRSQKFADHLTLMVQMEFKRLANVVRARVICLVIVRTVGKT